jgi:hypothetical protein
MGSSDRVISLSYEGGLHYTYMEFQLHVIVYRGYLMLYRIQSLIFFGYNLLLLLLLL